jgi:hypothetical protein
MCIIANYFITISFQVHITFLWQHNLQKYTLVIYYFRCYHITIIIHVHGYVINFIREKEQFTNYYTYRHLVYPVTINLIINYLQYCSQICFIYNHLYLYNSSMFYFSKIFYLMWCFPVVRIIANIKQNMTFSFLLHVEIKSHILFVQSGVKWLVNTFSSHKDSLSFPMCKIENIVSKKQWQF